MHFITTRIAIATMTLILAAFAFGQDRPEVFGIVVPFDRVQMNATTSAEQSVADACLKAIAMHPYVEPYDWPDAQATLRLEEDATSTDVTVHLTRVRPNTRYSTWLHRPGAASSAQAIGNDFWSDARGNATFRTRLGFRLLDVTGVPEEAPHVRLRVVSHCADHPGRAPSAGPSQPWFEWQAVPASIRSTASMAVPSARPARMNFSMSVPTQGGQAGAGPVRGDMVGHLYARLTGIDRTTPLWLVTYDWTFAAGPDTFTATLDGTYDSEARALLLAGIVDEGRLRGARIVVSATHSDIAGGHYRGTFQVHQD